MKDAKPQLPSGTSPRMFFMRCVWFALWGGRFPFGDTDTVKVDYIGGKYYFKIKPATINRTGSFRGEYDQTKSYGAGDTFKISTALTIAGATIAAGYYGVRPAAPDVDSQTFGPWAGFLPANPATAGIDMDKLFFNPENTYPTLGAAPNDKLYAELINSYC